jgi:hypothetical protein
MNDLNDCYTIEDLTEDFLRKIILRSESALEKVHFFNEKSLKESLVELILRCHAMLIKQSYNFPVTDYDLLFFNNYYKLLDFIERHEKK